jgi:hypothetical protein
MRCLLVLIVTVVSLGSVASAWAEGDAGPGEPLSNLIATPTVKANLLKAYRVAHPTLAGKRIVGPLPGRTFYGSFGGEYAVATFAISGQVTTPVIFDRYPGSAWNVLQETHGRICLSFLPQELVVSVWKMRPSGGGCYVEG